jgi:hypothetical protein
MPIFQIEVPITYTRVYYIDDESVTTVSEAYEAYLSGSIDLDLDDVNESHVENDEDMNRAFIIELPEEAMNNVRRSF